MKTVTPISFRSIANKYVENTVFSFNLHKCVRKIFIALSFTLFFPIFHNYSTTTFRCFNIVRCGNVSAEDACLNPVKCDLSLISATEQFRKIKRFPYHKCCLSFNDLTRSSSSSSYPTKRKAHWMVFVGLNTKILVNAHIIRTIL